MIRSRRWKEHAPRELLAERRWGIRAWLQPSKARPFNMVQGLRLVRGSDTLHRTPEARRWRTVLRMKARRELDELLRGTP